MRDASPVCPTAELLSIAPLAPFRVRIKTKRENEYALTHTQKLQTFDCDNVVVISWHYCPLIITQPIFAANTKTHCMCVCMHA